MKGTSTGKEIGNGIEIIDLALWIPKHGLLAITDLQLGNEEMLNAQGFFVPRINFAAIRKRLVEKIFPALKGAKAETMLINGDLKHEFGTISAQERNEAGEILDLLKAHCHRVILVKGNHDTILKPIADAKKVELVDSYEVPGEGILFTHGDKEPRKEALRGIRTIIIGHQHPSVTISDGVKRETYKCFLKGRWNGKTLLVMPSMNEVSMGTDIMRGGSMSPLIDELGDFEVYAVEEGVHFMGKASGLRQE